MTDARSTQEAAEVFALPNAAVQATQVAVEAWSYVTSGPRLGMATLVALEEWARVPPPIVLGQTAVSINTG